MEKKGQHGHSLSEREGERARESLREPNPCLDRLLLLFWAHYIEDGPHLLCTGSLQVIDHLLRTTKDRILLISSKRRMLQLKEETGHTPFLGGLVQTLGG